MPIQQYFWSKNLGWNFGNNEEVSFDFKNYEGGGEVHLYNKLMMIFHPVNSLIAIGNLWLVLLSKVWLLSNLV